MTIAEKVEAAVNAAVAAERELIAVRVYNATGLADLADAIRAGGVICGRWSQPHWQGASPLPSSESGAFPATLFGKPVEVVPEIKPRRVPPVPPSE